jgi:hypothetical protein
VERAKEVKRLQNMSVKERIAKADAYAVLERVLWPKKRKPRLILPFDMKWMGWVWLKKKK